MPSRFKQKVVQIGNLIKDQPMTGLEKVVWWTEYVIRNNGAPYLKNPRADVSWFDFLILDVVAFLFSVIIVTLFSFYYALKLIINRFVKRRPLKRKLQ